MAIIAESVLSDEANSMWIALVAMHTNNAPYRFSMLLFTVT
jgi:hypothetical protein